MERSNELEQIRQAIKDLEWCDPDSGSSEYAKDVLIELIPKLIVRLQQLEAERDQARAALDGLLTVLESYRKTTGVMDGWALQGWELKAKRALGEE